jgi:hypothetical protein
MPFRLTIDAESSGNHTRFIRDPCDAQRCNVTLTPTFDGITGERVSTSDMRVEEESARHSQHLDHTASHARYTNRILDGMSLASHHYLMSFLSL